ncbi:MAG: hypothetical protein IKN55_12665 [Oscillospiraceae bacterium]|nr:hypothetical protein [Oscillospiraceae bacterium]
MVKGVNHRVIEINRPESAYFERAVLYLRPELSDSSLQAVELAAERYLGDALTQKRRFRMSGWLWFALGMMASGVAAAGIFLLRWL